MTSVRNFSGTTAPTEEDVDEFDQLISRIYQNHEGAYRNGYELNVSADGAFSIATSSYTTYEADVLEEGNWSFNESATLLFLADKGWEVTSVTDNELIIQRTTNQNLDFPGFDKAFIRKCRIYRNLHAYAIK